MCFGCERSRQPSPGPVQPDRERCGADPENTCCLCTVKTVPCDQEQDLLITAPQRRTGLKDLRIGSQTLRAELRILYAVPGHARGQRRSSSFPAALVGQHAAGDPEQPCKLIRRHPIKSSPGDKKHLGDNIVPDRRIDSTVHERSNGSPLLAVHRFKSEALIHSGTNRVRDTPEYFTPGQGVGRRTIGRAGSAPSLLA